MEVWLRVQKTSRKWPKNVNNKIIFILNLCNVFQQGNDGFGAFPLWFWQEVSMKNNVNSNKSQQFWFPVDSHDWCELIRSKAFCLS